MKNQRITFRALILSAISVFAFAITHGQDQQQKAWYFNGKSLNFTDGVPQIESLNVEHTETASAANGVHDNSGDLLFHVIDNAIYDKEGNLMSIVTNTDIVDLSLPGSPPYAVLQMGSEVNFVNVPGSCSKFYVIYSNIDVHPNSSQGTYHAEQNFLYSIVDMSLNDGLGDIEPGTIDTPISFPIDIINQRFGMAISKERPNGTLNMYVGGGGYGSPPFDQVYKTVIDENGISTPTLIYETDYTSGTMELELSPDESMLAISATRFDDSAPSHNTDVLLLHLNPDGTLNENLGTDGATSISLPTGQSVRPFTGLEFSEDNNSLFIGALNYGVFEYDIFNLQASFITNSDNMGNSQLERGYDGLIYAATSSGTMDAIDPNIGNAVYQNHIDFQSDAIINNHHASISLSYMFPEVFDIWTLPDQIDGQVYNLDFAEESCFCCELYSGQEVESYLADASGVWEPGTGNNPFVINETVRVSEELRIASGTSVTIKDMRFEFSENARVVIEPGAYLKLDNTVFTSNDCNCGMWLGVEVWGTPSVSQYVSGG